MRIGQLLGERFMLERLAGRGGMGEVYRALDWDTGQPVALKVLHGQQGSDVARFEREARILAGLDHPLVVRYVAHSALPTGEPYLAMEWLEGEDLAARFSRDRPSVADGVALAVRVAESLAVLHERGIVHRDLKPSNVFLVGGRLDAIKLLDFGLARTDSATRMTDAGTLLGTVAYMAPEQARGADGLDARADVFALGCLLFECLTGQTPFAAVHATAVLTKILFEDTPRLRQRLPGTPEALDALLGRMLSKQPHDRPRDGRAAAEALRALGTPALMPIVVEDTVELPRTPAITDSEQRAVAVILIDAPATATPAAFDATKRQAKPLPQEDGLGGVAAEHGGRLQWLLDGSGAVLLSGAQVATDLAAQAARCALALGRHAAGRRLALAMGSSDIAGRQPVGPVIDRAARLLESGPALEHDAQRTLVLLDAATVGLLDAHFDVRDQGATAVLFGERDVAEMRTLLGKPTPCVGRERELRMLEGLFEDCVGGGGTQAILVTAQPGVGKSRLGQEFLGLVRARSEGAAIWIGRGDSLRAGSALGMLEQALAGACGIRAGEPLEMRRAKVCTHVAERIAENQRQRVIEFLGELIGTPFPDDDSVPLRTARGDAQLMGEQMRAAFLDFLAAECARNPVVLVLEDLHWGDRPTVQFIDRALRDLDARPLFVLAMARPEVHETFSNLWIEHALQEIRLRGLNRKAIERLARHVLGDKAEPAMLEKIARLSEGNAFYLEELIRWAAEERQGDLPRTVVAMVQSRLGELDDGSRRLLRAASVFGEVFWTGAIATLLGSEERTEVIRNRLSLLAERELLLKRNESRFPGQGEYAFRHALLREGAYAMLTDEDRTLGHRLAGQWLEAHGEQDALMLAEHLEKGGNGERAGYHYLRAAEQVSWAGDSTTAIAYLQRGLACDVSSNLRIALLGMLCELHYFQIELGAAALPWADELVRVAPRGSGPWVQGKFLLLPYTLHSGRIEVFLTALHELMEVEPSLGTASSLGIAFAVGATLLHHFGRGDEADLVIERMAVTAHAFGDRQPLTRYYWNAMCGLRATAFAEEPTIGLMHWEAAMTLADVAGHRRYSSIANAIVGMNEWLLGAWTEARCHLELSLVPDEEQGMASSFRPFALAWLLADHGAFAEARDRAVDLVASGRARRSPIDEGRGLWALAEVRRRAGELDQAEAEIQAALAVLGTACPFDVPGALATLAALRLAQGRPAEALAAAEDGMARYASMGACSYFFRGAFLRLVHAECLEATGNHEAAKAAIARARERLFAIAHKIDDAGYRKSFLENVPENRRIFVLARQWLSEDA